MSPLFQRRTFIGHSVASLLAAPLASCAPAVTAHANTPAETAKRHLSHLAPNQARLGVSVLDMQTGTTFGQREDERFAMCSTFKLPLAAMVLSAADRHETALEEKLSYTKADLVPHAPVTEQFVEQGFMTVGELARAGQITSDNVAANLLLRRFGGPAKFTEFCRSLGDSATRLDDYEPAMNLVPAGETRNTTTPRAMAQLVAKFMTDGVLSHESRRLLQSWMMETTTGKKRLRAGFPQQWNAGDKTGTNLGKGMLSCYNDIAVVWFDDRAPLIVTSFLESRVERENMHDDDQAVLARVGRVVSYWAKAALSGDPSPNPTP